MSLVYRVTLENPGISEFSPHKMERFTSNTIDSVDMLIREIKKARRLGYATDEGEREEVVCIAAPVSYSKHSSRVSISG